MRVVVVVCVFGVFKLEHHDGVENAVIYIHTYTYMHTYMHTYIHTYIHTYYIHTYIHTTYIYTYIHTYIHTTYIHTYMHIHTAYIYTYMHAHAYYPVAMPPTSCLSKMVLNFILSPLLFNVLTAPLVGALGSARVGFLVSISVAGCLPLL